MWVGLLLTLSTYLTPLKADITKVSLEVHPKCVLEGFEASVLSRYIFRQFCQIRVGEATELPASLTVVMNLIH